MPLFSATEIESTLLSIILFSLFALNSSKRFFVKIYVIGTSIGIMEVRVIGQGQGLRVELFIRRVSA